jgi:hypothetical protein
MPKVKARRSNSDIWTFNDLTDRQQRDRIKGRTIREYSRYVDSSEELTFAETLKRMIANDEPLELLDNFKVKKGTKLDFTALRKKFGSDGPGDKSGVKDVRNQLGEVVKMTPGRAKRAAVDRMQLGEENSPHQRNPENIRSGRGNNKRKKVEKPRFPFSEENKGGGKKQRPQKTRELAADLEGGSADLPAAADNFVPPTYEDPKDLIRDITARGPQNNEGDVAALNDLMNMEVPSRPLLPAPAPNPWMPLDALDDLEAADDAHYAARGGRGNVYAGGADEIHARYGGVGVPRVGRNGKFDELMRDAGAVEVDLNGNVVRPNYVYERELRKLQAAGPAGLPKRAGGIKRAERAARDHAQWQRQEANRLAKPLVPDNNGGGDGGGMGAAPPLPENPPPGMGPAPPLPANPPPVPAPPDGGGGGGGFDAFGRPMQADVAGGALLHEADAPPNEGQGFYRDEGGQGFLPGRRGMRFPGMGGAGYILPGFESEVAERAMGAINGAINEIPVGVREAAGTGMKVIGR